jgi:magnesium-transporting ATPase (P-type)
LRKFGGKKGLLEKLQSSKNGLKRNEDEVKKRKDKYGANEFKETPIKSILHRIYDHSQDSLLRILFVGSFVSILIGISKDISRVTN